MITNSGGNCELQAVTKFHVWNVITDWKVNLNPVSKNVDKFANICLSEIPLSVISRVNFSAGLLLNMMIWVTLCMGVHFLHAKKDVTCHTDVNHKTHYSTIGAKILQILKQLQHYFIIQVTVGKKSK